MCLALYMASSQPLATVRWAKEAPGFYVEELSADDSHVKKQFSLPHIYYAGSHEGCGCGFIKDEDVGEELARVEENYSKLAAYVREARENGAAIEFFSCWEGEQKSVPEFRETIRESTLLERGFQFKEKAFYRVA
jgi:hypothetical protein